MYKWLTAYVLKMTAEKVAKLKSEGKNNFEAKNDSQSYNAVTLSVVYGEVSSLVVYASSSSVQIILGSS